MNQGAAAPCFHYNIHRHHTNACKSSGIDLTVRPGILLLICLVTFFDAARADTYTFSAPPGSGPAESRALYEPLLALLSAETGDTFRYDHPDGWVAYQSDMQRGRFQLLLDDAHFASWRIAHRGHVPLARSRGEIRFVVVATRSGRIYSKEDLIARPLCGYPQPDLGTISVLRKFDGPFRLPQVLDTRSPLARVQRLLAGKCAGAVLARHQYAGSEAIRHLTGRLKIVTQSEPYPGLTLTAAGEIPESTRNAIRNALLSRAGSRATRTLRERLMEGDEFTAANAGEYRGLDDLLLDYPGFRR